MKPTHDETAHFDHKRGALCLIFAGLFFAAMAVFVRLAGDAPTFERTSGLLNPIGQFRADIVRKVIDFN